MRRLAVLLVAVLAIGAIPPARASVALGYASPPCDTSFAPTTTVYLPNITKTLGGPSGWVTPFIVQNVGFFSTTLEVSFYRFSDGGLVTCRKISQLQPSRSFADVPNNDPDLPDNSQFSVVVRSFGSEIVAVVNEQAGSGDRAEALAYDGPSVGSASVALPYVAVSANSWVSTIIVQNVGTSTAFVTAAFTSLDGSQTASVSRSIAPGRSSFVDPRFEASLRSGTEYSAILTSTAKIAVVVNSHNDTADVANPRAFAYNGFAVGAAQRTFLPLVARNIDGIGRTSRLIVQNAGGTSARPSLDFARSTDGGHVLMSPPTTLASGRAWSFSATNKADDTTPCPASGGGDCMGEGEYGATVSSGVYAALDILLSPTTAMAYLAAPSSESRMFLPNVTRTLGGSNGWTTPLVIQRPSDGPSSVGLRWYRFKDGRLVQQQIVSGINPGASVRIDPRTVSGLTDDTQYSVVVDGKGPISAIVLELNFSGGASAMIYPGFTSLVQAISVPAVIQVLPTTAAPRLGGTIQFSATVTDQFGAPASAMDWPLTWSVDPPSLGTITPTGTFTAKGYGSGKVTASAGATSTAITVTVQSPPPSAAAVPVPIGYSRLTVPTARGTFTVHVVKEPLASVSIRTATANVSDCVADCPAQPLLDYLNQNAAVGGMNGTYFCPPDYSGCAGQVNSYDYSVYSSPLGHWINEGSLVSPTNSLVTVTGKTMRFYQHTYDFDRTSSVDAAISNFPMLLLGGQIIDSSAIQTAKQTQLGVKGSIGTDGTYVFLMLVFGASVTDSAYAVQALGVTDAMNLDGGGSEAMFLDREYKVGPGRLLPNAVMLTMP